MNILTSTLTEGGIGYVTANENFFRLDAFVMFSIKDRDLSTPPGSPAEGDRYLVKATGTGAWASHDAAVAIYHNSAWIFFTPQEGWQMWVDDENVLLTYDGSAWQNIIISPTTRLINSVETSENTLRSPLLHTLSPFTFVSDTAYFLYMGRTLQTTAIKKAKVYIRNAGTGAQTAEIGIFSSPEAPNSARQSLTKIEATGTLDVLTAAGPAGNTNNFSGGATAIAAGTHIWVGMRTAMATTQPSAYGLSQDMGRGRCLSTATAGALTGSGPWTGSITTDTAGNTLAPLLEAYLS